MIVGLPLLRFLQDRMSVGASDLPEDGLGQSMVTDLKWMKRFRSAVKRSVAWTKPVEEDNRRFGAVLDVDKFGDFVLAAARVDDQRWFVIERFWNGWPDPPKFAFFAIEPNNSIWAAADFHHWPKRWSKQGFEI